MSVLTATAMASARQPVDGHTSCSSGEKPLFLCIKGENVQREPDISAFLLTAPNHPLSAETTQERTSPPVFLLLLAGCGPRAGRTAAFGSPLNSGQRSGHSLPWMRWTVEDSFHDSLCLLTPLVQEKAQDRRPCSRMENQLSALPTTDAGSPTGNSYWRRLATPSGDPRQRGNTPAL